MRKVILLSFVVLFFTNCSIVRQTIAGKEKTSQKNFTLDSKKTIIETKQALFQSLQSKGWKVVNENNQTILFEKSNSYISKITLSKRKFSLLSATIHPDKIDVSIINNGNNQYGTVEKIDEVFKDIAMHYHNFNP